MPAAEQIRLHLRFDVARLRSAALRLQAVDGDLRRLRIRLEARARTLADEADGEPTPLDDDGRTDVAQLPLRAAQAQATAELSRRAALGEILRHSGTLPLISAMAVSRWVEAMLRTLPTEGIEADVLRRRALAKGHIDAGRIAHRMLATLRGRAGLRSGCGQLVCAVVVAELAPEDLQDFLAEQIEEGWERALHARAVSGEAGALFAASAALREGARLLETMADRAAPAVATLLEQADAVEARVAATLDFRDGEM